MTKLNHFQTSLHGVSGTVFSEYLSLLRGLHVGAIFIPIISQDGRDRVRYMNKAVVEGRAYFSLT